MKLLAYPLLSTCSKRSLRRRAKRLGKPHHYRPQAKLIKRLSHQLGMSEDAVLDQIMREREYLIKLLS